MLIFIVNPCAIADMTKGMHRYKYTYIYTYMHTYTYIQVRSTMYVLDQSGAQNTLPRTTDHHEPRTTTNYIPPRTTDHHEPQTTTNHKQPETLRDHGSSRTIGHHDIRMSRTKFIWLHGHQTDAILKTIVLQGGHGKKRLDTKQSGLG